MTSPCSPPLPDLCCGSPPSPSHRNHEIGARMGLKMETHCEAPARLRLETPDRNHQSHRWTRWWRSGLARTTPAMRVQCTRIQPVLTMHAEIAFLVFEECLRREATCLLTRAGVRAHVLHGVCFLLRLRAHHGFTRKGHVCVEKGGELSHQSPDVPFPCPYRSSQGLNLQPLGGQLGYHALAGPGPLPLHPLSSLPLPGRLGSLVPESLHRGGCAGRTFEPEIQQKCS